MGDSSEKSCRPKWPFLTIQRWYKYTQYYTTHHSTQLNPLFLRLLLSKSNCNTSDIDDWQNNISPYCSKFQSNHSLIKLVFGIISKRSQVDLCRNSMKLCLPLLRCYSFTWRERSYNIHAIYPDCVIDRISCQWLFRVVVSMDASFWIIIKCLLIYPHYHSSHRSYSDIGTIKCCYCALRKIKAAFLPIHKN